MPTIKDLKKGAHRDPPDRRDYRVGFATGAPTPIDWVSGSGLPRPVPIDQDQADCCVACAWSYYHWQIRGQPFSRRDLFARIALSPPGNGAYIRDGGLAIANQGQALETDLPDPPDETEVNMRDKTGVTGTDELPWKEYNSFTTATDIESAARNISLYKGIVGGVYGTDDGWANLAVPEPPTALQMQSLDQMIQVGTIWEHALYFMDFHMHQNADGTQEECIITATSWPNSKQIDGSQLTEHHLRARYFTTGAVFNPWTLVPSSTVAAVLQNVTLTVPEQ